MEKRNDVVFLIGGGLLQYPMVQEIKRRGYRLIITDGNRDCYCRPYANEFYAISTYDRAGHSSLAAELRKRHAVPVAVLTDAADVGMTVSAVAEQLGLPACPALEAHKINSKDELRAALALPYPVYLTCHSYTAKPYEQLWQERCTTAGVQAYPCVVKPVDNCASRGITKVNSADQLNSAIAKALTYNHHDYGTVLIEQCLQGQEYATDWYVGADGEIVLVNAAKRIFNEFGIELGHTNPWLQPLEVSLLAKYVASKFPRLTGPLKLDLLHDARYGWCVLEAATRWSGGYDHGWTAKYATERNLEKPLLDYALGLEVDYGDLIVQRGGYYSACYAYYEADYAKWQRLREHDSLHNKDNHTTKRPPHVERIITQQWQAVKGDIAHNAERNVFVIATGTSEELAWQTAVNFVGGV